MEVENEKDPTTTNNICNGSCLKKSDFFKEFLSNQQPSIPHLKYWVGFRNLSVHCAAVISVKEQKSDWDWD